LQEFCRLTHILFRSGGPEDVAAMIGQAYLNLLARYEIVYQPIATNASHLKVRVQTPGAWGEAVIAVPPEPQAPG
jgi:hypothetical protein